MPFDGKSTSGMTSDQPCWDCKKALGGCSWSQDFIPVAGWEAQKTVKSGGARSDGVKNPPVESYRITFCPEFEAEEPRAVMEDHDTGNPRLEYAARYREMNRERLREYQREYRRKGERHEHQTDGE